MSNLVKCDACWLTAGCVISAVPCAVLRRPQNTQLRTDVGHTRKPTTRLAYLTHTDTHTCLSICVQVHEELLPLKLLRFLDLQGTEGNALTGNAGLFLKHVSQATHDKSHPSGDPMSAL